MVDDVEMCAEESTITKESDSSLNIQHLECSKSDPAPVHADSIHTTVLMMGKLTIDGNQSSNIRFRRPSQEYIDRGVLPKIVEEENTQKRNRDQENIQPNKKQRIG